MSTDLGIIFELQWKKKTGGNNREDVASIGIWDTPDSSLDWMTFKSYVCQNLGTTEDIYVAYIDSDGDELPIESECEFQEALKFARQRATKGREVVLKVDKRGCRLFTPPSSEPKQKGNATSKGPSDSEKDLKKKHVKITGKITSKTKSGDKVRSSACQSLLTVGGLSGMEERKSKIEDHTISNELSKKLACIMKLETEKRKKAKVDKDDSPPPWFKKYMQKFKSEIVAEVTTNVMYNTRQILENTKMSSHSTCSSCCEKNDISISATKTKKKKKISDDDSSDCALSSDQRDHKLLKKIEKLHKREKKLEKKLDSKLEKLENKTKRRMEKKFQHKSCTEQPSEKKVCSGSRKRLSDMPVGTYLMDAIPLNDGPKTAELHIKLGERFTKVWEIMNNGTLPWTDKTELRLAWGTSGLEPEATILKCPILLPGEKGEIAVTFRAPEFPGTFESYWHFYHMGDRFGHWLGCAVIVDSKETGKQSTEICGVFCNNESTDSVVDDKEECKTKSDQPVDLRMKCEPKQLMNAPDTAVDHLCDRVNEDKSAETITFGNVKRNAEYESDSDDENLSVISGTISLSSDSEEDENFVVVPMPACFMCDVPLEKSNTVLVDLNENSKDDIVEGEAVANTKPSDTCTTDVQCPKNEIEHERQIFTECDVTDLKEETPIYEEAKFVSSSKNVYAVDMEGHCMPVNFTWENNMNKNDKNSDGSIPKNESEIPPRPEKKEEPKSEPLKRALFHTHCHSQASGPFHSSFQTGYVGNCPNYDTTFKHYTSSSSSSTNGCKTASANTCNGSSPNQPQDPQGAPVHILPETLVTGAINVASQAFTTARAVLNNLRSRPSEEFADWQWDESAANWSAQTDRSTTESLKILLEMGFTNKILNVLLLQRYDNDIAKVVAELLTYKDNPGFIYNRQTQ